MAFATWIASLNPTVRVTRTSRSCGRRRARRGVRLNLEQLEDRTTPATFTVTNTLDDGTAGNLRRAINQLNA
jgi:hypothetical protein